MRRERRKKGSIPLGKQEKREYKDQPMQGVGMQELLQAGVVWSTLKADFSNTFQLLVAVDPHFPDKIPWERSQHSFPGIPAPTPHNSGVSHTQGPAANISQSSRDLQLGILARDGASLQDEPRGGENQTLQQVRTRHWSR